MAENVATSSILTCRRCGKSFTPPTSQLFLPSCPHCGTSLKPLWHSLHNNRNAAVLSIFASEKCQDVPGPRPPPAIYLFAWAVSPSRAPGFCVNLPPPPGTRGECRGGGSPQKPTACPKPLPHPPPHPPRRQPRRFPGS